MTNNTHDLIDLTRMVVYDITAKMFKEMPCWPGERHRFEHSYAKSFSDGDTVNVSRISSSMHTGTHIDAPYHKNDTGKKLEEIPIERFIGNAYVIDLMHLKYKITKKDLIEINIPRDSIYLLKTSNSKYLTKQDFHEEYIYLVKDAAEYLVECGALGVCVDYLSIDAKDVSEPHAHNILFENDVMLYEAVDLSEVRAGHYYFIGLPLRLLDAEGALVRAVLIGEKNE